MGEWTKEPWMVRAGLFAPHQDGYRDCDIQICSKDLLHVAILHSELPTGAPNANRIVACVNAMQGIPDPEKFVEAAKRLRNGFKLAIGLLEMDANKNELIAEFDQALAAKPEEANDVATD